MPPSVSHLMHYTQRGSADCVPLSSSLGRYYIELYALKSLEHLAPALEVRTEILLQNPVSDYL